jgi:peptidoglycan/LPS O-acetylase OafA/YrhL
VLFSEARSLKPEAGSSAALRHSDTTFISITLVRALAIVGIIIENYHNTLGWHDGVTFSDFFTASASTVGGTFVHMFFVLSGYGLTLSILKKENVSWTAWARERFQRIVLPYWAAVVVTFAVANLSYHWAPAGWEASYSWVTLLAYLSFLRNIYEPGWALNPAFWFMPALVGLYVLFPLLLAVLRRIGMTGLLIFSILLTNVAIALFVKGGYSVDHQAASTLFFVDEFAMGMVLACITYQRPELIRRLMTLPFFLLGVVSCAVSAVLSGYNLLGYGSAAYNDLFETIGLYLILLCVCRWMSEAFSPAVLNVLDNVSRRSYIMYLIHWPIIAYMLKPAIGAWYRTSMGALPMLLSSFVFVMLMFILAEGISSLTKRLIPVTARILPARQE